MQRLITNFGCFILAAAAIVVSQAGCGGDIDKASPKIALDALRFPVLFEKNRGQTSKSIRYLARGSGFNFFLKQDEVILSLARAPKQAPITRKGFENAPDAPTSTSRDFDDLGTVPRGPSYLG